VRHFRQTLFDTIRMLKKSLKYIIVVTVNLILLTVLLALWTDKLELTFNEWVRPREFLKIMAFSFLSLISIGILITFFRRRNITTTRLKIKMAALLTFFISSYLYIDYSKEVISNGIVNRQFRKQIADKIQPSNWLANGTKSENLTIKEYEQIAKMYWFPKLPSEASNIQYDYGYDGFLPDYSFTLKYDLPMQIEVDTINYAKGDFSKHQSFEIVDNKKRVTYSENEQ
jgi:hypothetical protein